MKLRNKKTGKIYTARSMWFNESIDDLEKTSWKTLKEFCEDWKDVEEPLIKDPKARKAVRAWAGMQGSVWIVKETDQCCRDSLGYFFNSIKEIFGDLELGVEYTIAELCGEEEE